MTWLGLLGWGTWLGLMLGGLAGLYFGLVEPLPMVRLPR